MRFDSTLYYHFAEPYEWEKLIDEFEEEVKFLDEAGFTTAWIAEHHFSWDGWFRATTNPILVGSHLAANTKKLRVGQCGVILPDWHPLRVAEDIAMLDQLTRGRVDFGVARGYNSRAALQFNPNADRGDQKKNFSLFAECLDIIIGAWTNDAFTYKGEFYSFPVPGWKEVSPHTYDPRYHSPDGELTALGVVPKPFQKPHPPIWQMADSASSHRFAAGRGLGVICMRSSPEKIRQMWAAYQDAASEKRGESIAFGDNLAIMRPTYVARTMEEAVSDIRWGVNHRASLTTTRPDLLRKGQLAEGELTEDDLLMDTFDFELSHDLILVGTPDSVAEQIERLRSQLNCQHLVLFHNQPGLTFEKVMRSLDMFTEQVMPQFQDAGPAQQPGS